MSYGRINKPRFFVDHVNWQVSRGRSLSGILDFTVDGDTWTFNTGSTVYQAFDLDPTNICSIDSNGEAEECVFQINWDISVNWPITFIALLNHNLDTAGADLWLQSDSSAVTRWDFTENIPLTPLIGCSAGAVGEATFSADGDCIVTCTDQNDQYYGIIIKPSVGNYSADLEIGTILIGSHYTAPYSGDSQPKRGFGLEGVKLLENEAGKRFGKARQIGGASGDNYKPFRNQTYFRRPVGREYFEVVFSGLLDTELFPEDPSACASESGMFYNLHNKTAGMFNPLIVNYDSESTDMGDYLFGRLMNKPEYTETDHRIWRAECRIEEEI